MISATKGKTPVETPFTSDDCQCYVPLSLEQIQNRGFGVVSPHFIPMGSKLITEAAAVVVPKLSIQTNVCVACLLPLQKKEASCQRCQLPLCEACGSQGGVSETVHPECSVFAGLKDTAVRNGLLKEPRGLVGLLNPLRLLLKAEQDPGLLGLESMEAARKNTLLYHLNEGRVVKSLLGLGDRFSADMAHKACGILDTNCYDVKWKNNQLARGLFKSIGKVSPRFKL